MAKSLLIISRQSPWSGPGAREALASVLAGLLWERYGAAATFYAGAAFSLLSLLALGWHARFGGMR